MYVEINLFGVSILLLIFAILLAISQPRRAPATASSRPPNKERRAHPRYKTSLRIKYKTPLEEGISWIKDISKSGARLFLNNTLKTLGIGDSLEIEIALPYEAQPVTVQGNIVWSKDEDAGFQFEKILQGSIERIIQYVSSEEGAQQ